jgi:hypothetical protein
MCWCNFVIENRGWERGIKKGRRRLPFKELQMRDRLRNCSSRRYQRQLAILNKVKNTKNKERKEQDQTKRWQKQ